MVLENSRQDFTILYNRQTPLSFSLRAMAARAHVACHRRGRGRGRGRILEPVSDEEPSKGEPRADQELLVPKEEPMADEKFPKEEPMEEHINTSMITTIST